MFMKVTGHSFCEGHIAPEKMSPPRPTSLPKKNTKIPAPPPLPAASILLPKKFQTCSLPPVNG